jgi:hypothetical protein
MTKGPIQPGRILENFQSLVHEGEEHIPFISAEETTPTFRGENLASNFSQENPQQKKLTENLQRPISKIWRN